MPELHIRKADGKAVYFEGAGDYLFVAELSIWVMSKCKEADDYEAKKGRPMVHLTASDVKKFDYCG